MRELVARLRDWLRRDRLEAELSEELRFHRERLERDARAAGAPAGEAADAARRQLGNITSVTEATRERWSIPSLDHAQQDVRYAWRALRRSPGFALIAVVTLGLGIASTTATFSVVDSIVLRGLPYRDPEQLAAIYERSDDGRFRTPSYPTFADWQAQTATVADAIEGFAFIRGDGVKFDDDSERRIAAYVTPGFFPLVGTRPVLGRTFAADEERPGAPRVAVISWQLFLQRFAGQPSAIGQRFNLNGEPTTVIGVMPHAFALPNFGRAFSIIPSVWQPIAVFRESHPQLALRGLHADSRTIIRLKPSADSVRVAAAMRTIQQRLAAEYPLEQAHWTSVALQPMDDQVYGNLRQLLVMISGAIALVLLLACANVANLFLVRGSVRSRELAVRTALGASRFRLTRQLMAEAALLAAAAGSAGLLLAAALVGVVRRSATEQLPFASELQLDARTALFALAVSLLTALAIGILPALRVGAGDLMRRLRSGGTTDRDRYDRRLRYGIMSVQFAFAVTLLVGAGLLIQSFRRLASVPLGYDANGVIAFAIKPPARYDKPADAAALYARILERMERTPGVASAAAAGGALMPTPVETDDAEGRATIEARYHPVSSEYFDTMRIPLLAGRTFTDDDMRAATGFVINDKLARQIDPSGSVIGKRITVRRSSQARADFGAPITLPVIGVVGNVRQFGPAADSEPEVMLPYTLEVWPWMNFVARASTPERLLPAVERAVREVEPGIEFLGRPSVMRAGAAGIDAQRRFLTLVLSGFAAAALLLASVGLYSIVAYGVAQRQREFGVRIALGASEGQVVGLVLRDGAAYIIAGAALGLFGAYMSTRLIRSLLFQTTAADPATIVIVTVVLTLVTLLAIYGPARRATKSDPMIAIRAE